MLARALIALVLAITAVSAVVSDAHGLTQAQRTVFYSGLGIAGANEAREVGAYTMIYDRGIGHVFDGAEIWKGTSECNSNRAIPRRTNRSFDRLVGYSVGRLGPAYYLQQFEQKRQVSGIRTVVLLDPGVESQFNCDRKSGAGRTYATWLRQNAANRLIIITAAASARDGYVGLRNVYTSKLTASTVGSNVGQRVLVCDAPKIAHDHVVRKFSSLISGARPTACPRDTRPSALSPQSVAPAPAPEPDPPASPAPSGPTVSLAQGPVAPYGYRYAISASGFAPNSSVTVVCRDSVDRDGFFTFQLATDASGNGGTADQCYSADGPDHWVTANDVESNHVSW